MLADPELTVRVTAHHIEMAGVSQDSCVLQPTRNLLDQDVKAACLGHLEALNRLVALLELLMIKAELAIGVITPHEDLCEVKCLGDID